MSNDIKVFIGVIIATLVLIIGAVFLLSGNSGNQGNQTKDSKPASVSRDLLVRSDSWKTGSDSAKVTVVEFSDFQCPSCKAAEPMVQQVIKKYQDQILFVYRFFPLPQHQFAMDSALAAEAAGKQNKFWEYGAKLFDNQPADNSGDSFKRDKLIGYAKDLGLNADQFTKDMDSDTARQHVLNDQADGTKAGVNATPTFFINGTVFVGATDLDSEIASRLH